MARTSVANASLIIGLVPMVVALANAALGLERLSRALLDRHRVSAVGHVLRGRARRRHVGDEPDRRRADLRRGAGWSAYTVAAKPLLARHSPLVVTGWSMALGTLLLPALCDADMLAVDWRQVSAGAWIGTSLSALLALNLSYVLWNTAVQRLGSSRPRSTRTWSRWPPSPPRRSGCDEPISGWKRSARR